MTARRRLPPGLRKQLREARLMTLIGLVFVVGGAWAISQGSAGLGVAAVLFFGACLLWGVLQWWSTEAELRGRSSEQSSRGFAFALLGVGMLLGLASLAVVALALFGWDQFSFATRAKFPRPVVGAAGVAGALLFLGGPVLLLVRKGRPLGVRGREDDD